MKIKKRSVLIALIIITITVGANVWGFVPTGPTIVYKGNSTSERNDNTVESNSSIFGGVIATLLLTGRQQTTQWKAYVGNVSGTYVLEDAANYSIYEWAMTSVTGGEVYASRASAPISWGSVACAVTSNITFEESRLSHNSTSTPGNSINETFDDDSLDHWGFNAGPTTISANSCVYSINPWINDSAQTGAEYFEEIVLQDSNANLIYTSKIENNLYGYRNDTVSTYDFQMLIPENASDAWSGATDYYFYIEIT